MNRVLGTLELRRAALRHLPSSRASAMHCGFRSVGSEVLCLTRSPSHILAECCFGATSRVVIPRLRVYPPPPAVSSLKEM